MRALAVVLVLWLMLSTGSRGAEVFEKVGGSTFTGYIVPKAAGEVAMGWYNDPKWLDADGGWVPSVAQVTEAERMVRHFIERASKNAQVAFPHGTKLILQFNRKKLAEIESNYAKYEIQFVGITVRGRREIFCNYFRNSPGLSLDPSRQFVEVCDGGSWFWNVRFVPETKECTALDINGDA
jgi:hypothetical protein